LEEEQLQDEEEEEDNRVSSFRIFWGKREWLAD